jgi:Subtilase family/Carboxypeptidase regulatory-like domain
MRRSLITAGVVAAVGALVLSGTTVVTTPDALAEPQPKITSALLDAYSEQDTTDLWVRMAERANLSTATSVTDRAERGRKVVDALTTTANRSQAPVRKLLAAEGLKSRAFWAANAIHVEDVPEEVARTIAAMPQVAELREVAVHELPKPVETTPSSAAAQGIEWGIENINADDVWAQTGRRGEDIVIANIDTGVQFDHPTLVRQYRGNNGDGTFTHDYNWADAPSGTCDNPAPCDTNGHGTHTMGTMAGDDGQGNQIGVAPGVKWIAAKGCETSACSSASLLAASEWMLAPTDAKGENPDVTKRPHIVNNSWGTSPSNDPFLEEVQQAWAASGIMGIWANGNEGPGCETSGAPGSRTINYSVGAYDLNNKVAHFSSRGPGQDGDIKPNISAPGVDVRSALPGNRYALYDGTSMATPHVSGAVALLWSAVPEYARDLEATKLALDLSAVDTPDDQCGGTAGDNPVYGEGRLDALALVNTASRGIATLTGSVTDAGTGAVLAGATVTVTGLVNRTVPVDADGGYRFLLPAGEYQLSARAFGYQTFTETVTLAKDQTLARDVAMAPTERVNLTGTVTDGSGQGWGLGASITAKDAAGHSWSTQTDPATGDYTLPLLPDLDYTVTFTPTVPGYDGATRPVSLGATGQDLDVALTVSLACTARGYQVTRNGVTEPFGGTRAPRGWTVTNVDVGIPNLDHEPGWVFNDPGKRGNHTGGAGGFAIVDSRHYGKGHIQDTYLTSPSFNLTGKDNATIELAHDLEPAANSTTTVEVSLDGGRTWTKAWTHAGYPGAPGPAVLVVPIPQANGKADVRFRLFYQGQRSGWWAVDDVFVGHRTCTPIPQ